MASKLLEDLNKLRENLEKNTKKVPDYHIKTKISKNPSEAHEKYNQAYSGPRKEAKPERTAASPDNIKAEIYNLIDYGFNQRRAQIAVTDKTEQKYETYRFKSIPTIVDILNEYSKTAKRIIFVFDKRYNTIYWENSGVQEIRIIVQ